MARKVSVTPLQLDVLRAFHEDPTLAACDIGARLQVMTWSIHEAVGSLWVDGLLTVDGGHHLTAEGAAAIGVELAPGYVPPAPAPAAGQLGLFGVP